MEPNVEVFSYSLRTLNKLSKGDFEHANPHPVGKGTASEVRVFVRNADSLEQTIDLCNKGLLEQAKKMSPRAFVVEAKYIPMKDETYATGVPVKESSDPLGYT